MNLSERGDTSAPRKPINPRSFVFSSLLSLILAPHLLFFGGDVAGSGAGAVTGADFFFGGAAVFSDGAEAGVTGVVVAVLFGGVLSAVAAGIGALAGWLFGAVLAGGVFAVVFGVFTGVVTGLLSAGFVAFGVDTGVGSVVAAGFVAFAGDVDLGVVAVGESGFLDVVFVGGVTSLGTGSLAGGAGFVVLAGVVVAVPSYNLLLLAVEPEFVLSTGLVFTGVVPPATIGVVDTPPPSW